VFINKNLQGFDESASGVESIYVGLESIAKE
jgi:hypothetical protein